MRFRSLAALGIILAAPAFAAEPPLAAPALVVAADPLVEGFKGLETGSVADAMEVLYGTKAYLSHEFRPLQEDRFVGRAATLQFRKEEHRDGAPAISGMIDLIDSSPAGSVFVMSLPDGLGYGAIGGLMSTAMKARGFAGAVVDGGVRDTGQIRKLHLPVFSRSVVPSTTVNHYRFESSNQPVTISGVRISPGDIIIADSDGIVVVPADKAAAVLERAQQFDFIEHSQIPYIERYRSLKKAVEVFGRI